MRSFLPARTLIAVCRAFGAALLLAGCDHQAGARGPTSTAASVDSIRALRLAEGRRMKESSAAAASVAYPGRLYSLNDSGNDPVVFAFDTTGADLGEWTLANAHNRDWEALAIGPCGDRSCLYVGDVGDNMLRRPRVVLYRADEPAVATSARVGGAGANVGEPPALANDSLLVRYPDGAHNVEAMVVTGDGSVLLITKEPIGNGRASRPTLVYRVPPEAWSRPGAVVATRVDSLPIVPQSARARLVTDAALSGDGRWLAVRTYAELYLFAADSLTGATHGGRTMSVCSLAPLDEAQGEGVGFLRWEGPVARVALTSEGSGEPLRLANCPLPVR